MRKCNANRNTRYKIIRKNEADRKKKLAREQRKSADLNRGRSDGYSINTSETYKKYLEKLETNPESLVVGRYVKVCGYRSGRVECNAENCRETDYYRGDWIPMFEYAQKTGMQCRHQRRRLQDKTQ